MEIDRSNFESWFIDYAEGNLDNQQVEKLEAFLSENPDLKDDFTNLLLFRITPPGITFKFKDRLKKLPSELSQYQFDYLCAAYFENDLDAGRQAELTELTASDPGRRRAFELMGKSRLIADKTHFKNKHLLLKHTIFRKTIRISALALSSAAAIILVITIFLNTVEETFRGKKSESHITSVSEPAQKLPLRTEPDKIRPDKLQKEANGVTKEAAAHKTYSSRTSESTNITPAAVHDSAENITRKNDFTVNKVPVAAGIDFKTQLTTDALVVTKSSVSLPVYQDDRTKIGRFISRTFREKLLREKSPPDTPLKAYEIAEAGVNGINRLLGWQMALAPKNDDNGQLKSVYFSSRLLKFNAPVKKNESAP